MNDMISRYPVPELKDLPEDLRTRILEVQEKAGECLGNGRKTEHEITGMREG